MHVWDRARFGELSFDAADAGLAWLGTIVENRELQWALEGSAERLETIRMYRPQRLQHLEAGPRSAALALDDARLQAALVDRKLGYFFVHHSPLCAYDDVCTHWSQAMSAIAFMMPISIALSSNSMPVEMDVLIVLPIWAL